MRDLSGRVAVVTGGTFGVGRGVASVLAECGARVFVTGRSVVEGGSSDGRIVAIRCDHRLDDEVLRAFERIATEAGKIDILVNNVWGGYERMVEDGAFTWTKPFLGAAVVAMGLDVHRGLARALCGVATGGQVHGDE